MFKRPDIDVEKLLFVAPKCLCFTLTGGLEELLIRCVESAVGDGLQTATGCVQLFCEESVVSG